MQLSPNSLNKSKSHCQNGDISIKSDYGLSIPICHKSSSQTIDICTESDYGLAIPECDDMQADSIEPNYDLPTPVCYHMHLEPDLKCFDKGKKVLLDDGFKFGFKVFFEGEEVELFSKNSKSAVENIEEVDKKLSVELDKLRIAGPLDEIPFDNFKCSPLAIREKSEKGKYRLLHNLSYPYDENSLNYNIPKSESTVKYQSIDDALCIMRKLGKGCYLAKSDISEAFRLLPLHPSQYHLMGFKWKNKYYYDRCLPMGCSSSCRLFESFSDAIVHILKTKYEVLYIVKVLDDFLFLSDREDMCQLALDSFLALCQKAGIPVAMKKTTKPTHCLTFLGFELDSVRMEIRLPQDKLEKYAGNIQSCLGNHSISLRALRSITGQLQYATSVVKPGKAFLRRLISMQIGYTNPNTLIRITDGARRDLVLWKSFLELYNGKTILYEIVPVSSYSINLYSDASKLGFGGTFGSNWIQGHWPEGWKEKHITVLETYPLLALIMTFGHKMRNSWIKFHCDNMAVVEIINKQSSKDGQIMSIVRPLVLKLLLLNISFQAVHIPGVTNIISDRLSRFQTTSEFLAEHKMSPVATPIPLEANPQNL